MVNRISSALDREMVEKSGIPADMAEYMLSTTSGISMVANKLAKIDTPMDIIQTYADLLESCGPAGPDANHYTMTCEIRTARHVAQLIAITSQYMFVEGKFKRGRLIADLMQFVNKNMRQMNSEFFAVSGDLVDAELHTRVLKILVHSMTHVYHESIKNER